MLRVLRGGAKHERCRRAARTGVAVAVATGALDARGRDPAGQGVAPGSTSKRSRESRRYHTQFRGDAHGTRSDWNPRSATTFWGNKVAWRFPDVLPGSADIQTFLTSLGLRPDASGEPVVNRLGAPEWKGDGWFRLEWNHKTRRHELSIATHAGWSQDTIVPFVRNKAPGTILNFISDLFVVDAKGQRHEVEYRLWETDVGELDFPLSFVLVEQVSQGDAANHTGYTPW